MNAPPVITAAMLRVSLWCRLGAILYDVLALFGVLFVAGIPVVALHGGEAIAPHNVWFTTWLCLAAFGYLGYSWRRGRTLGMQSWKIRLIDARTGGAASWAQTAVRFVAALLSWLPAGFGFWRALWNPERAAWHDLVSSTRLVRDFRPRPHQH
ncbi:MAG: RDD family protein [Gammaproteobacteria bacterium]|nr:RDD family protein [Gammaproteobacteria bacterium]